MFVLALGGFKFLSYSSIRWASRNRQSIDHAATSLCIRTILAGLLQRGAGRTPVVVTRPPAVRLVIGLGPRGHVTEDMMDLYWLPIKLRISLKLSKLCLTVQTCLCPSYIRDIITPLSNLPVFMDVTGFVLLWQASSTFPEQDLIWGTNILRGWSTRVSLSSLTTERLFNVL